MVLRTATTATGYLLLSTGNLQYIYLCLVHQGHQEQLKASRISNSNFSLLIVLVRNAEAFLCLESFFFLSQQSRNESDWKCIDTACDEIQRGLHDIHLLHYLLGTLLVHQDGQDFSPRTMHLRRGIHDIFSPFVVLAFACFQVCCMRTVIAPHKKLRLAELFYFLYTVKLEFVAPA